MKGIKVVRPMGRKAKGFSLIELLLVLAVAVLLIVVGFVLYQQNAEGARSDQAQKQLLGLRSGIARLYTTPNYTGISAASIITAGQAPSNMVNGNALQGPWGGAVTVAAANWNGGTANAFTITFNNVPRSECNTMAAAVQNNFVGITVGSTAVKNATTAFNSTTLATACNNDSNAVVFTATG